MNKKEPIKDAPVIHISIAPESLQDGYPAYPEDEDIYRKSIQQPNTDPEATTTLKTDNTHGKQNEKTFKEDVSGADLDIPGSELDDISENIGSEDEENNHYSLGGDNHTNLEEEREE